MSFPVHIGSFHIAAETDNDGIFRMFDFPWIIIFEPCVRKLCLPAVYNLLPEQTELIAQADAAAIDADGRHGI